MTCNHIEKQNRRKTHPEIEIKNMIKNAPTNRNREQDKNDHPTTGGWSNDGCTQLPPTDRNKEQEKNAPTDRNKEHDKNAATAHAFTFNY